MTAKAKMTIMDKIKKTKEEKKEDILVEINTKLVSPRESKMFEKIKSAFIENTNVDYYFQFGDDLRHILDNLIHYELNVLHGWNDISLTKFGWLEFQEFEIVEEIDLGTSKKYKHLTNNIRIGVSPNGLYQYGYSLGTEFYGGRSSGICVFGTPYNSKDEALISVLELFKNLHSDYVDCETSRNVLVKVEKHLEILKKVDQNNQLLLF